MLEREVGGEEVDEARSKMRIFQVALSQIAILLLASSKAEKTVLMPMSCSAIETTLIEGDEAGGS